MGKSFAHLSATSLKKDLFLNFSIFNHQIWLHSTNFEDVVDIRWALCPASVCIHRKGNYNFRIYLHWSWWQYFFVCIEGWNNVGWHANAGLPMVCLQQIEHSVTTFFVCPQTRELALAILQTLLWTRNNTIWNIILFLSWPLQLSKTKFNSFVIF